MTKNDLTKCMKIAKKLILDNSLSDWEFNVCSLILDQAGDNNCIVLSKKVLCITYCMEEAKRSIKNNIHKALDSLISRDLITPINIISSDIAIYDISALQDYSNIYGGYIRISYDEINQIASYKEVAYRSKLLRYFSYIIMHFNNSNSLPRELRGKYGFRKMKTINDDFHICTDNNQWIIEINKILQDLQLLYVQSSRKYMQHNTSGISHRPPNIYCRYEDAAGALDYAVKYAGWDMSIKMNIEADNINNDGTYEKDDDILDHLWDEE